MEIEPRLLKEIYESAEIMFNSLKLAEIRSFKYEKLFRLTSENNEYNKCENTFSFIFQKIFCN